MKRFIKNIFTGSGGVRSGWRFAGFLTLVSVVIYVFSDYIEPFAAKVLGIDDSKINASVLLLNELGLYFPAVLVATRVAAWLERRRIDTYGLPFREAFGSRYWEGTALGLAAAAAVAISMVAAHGFIIRGLGLHGTQWLVQPVLYALAMILVGITESICFAATCCNRSREELAFGPQRSSRR